MTKAFTITWEKVPLKIAVHVSSKQEAKHVALEYLSSLMKIEESRACFDADIELPLVTT